MKKAIVLLLFILLVSTGVSAATDGNTHGMTDLLFALDIISPQQLETEDSVTRGEFAANVVRFMNVDIVPDMYDASFEDVTEYSENSKEIYYLKHENIISGAQDGNFYSDMPISKKHAAVILARALGYGSLPDSTESYATGLKLIGMSDEELSHEEMVSLFYNALKSKVVVRVVSPEEKYVYGEEYLYETFGVCENEGIVKSNSLTTLDGNSKPLENRVVIDNHLLFTGDCNGDEFLGMAVNYYYIPANRKENTKGKDMLVAISSNSKNDIEEIPGKDIISFDGRILTYAVENKVKTIEIDGDDDVIYNGVACPDYEEEYIWSKSGKITYIDNGSSSACIKAEKYENSIVSMATDEVVYFKDGSYIEFDEFEEGKLSFTDKEGNILDTIPAGAVMSKYKSADGSVLKGVCSTELLENVKIVAIDEEGIETENGQLCINSLYTSWKEAVGNISSKTYMIYLDACGEVAKIEKTSGGEPFAYLLDIRDDIGGLDGTVYVKMLLETGNIEILECSQRISLNGVREDSENLISKLQYTKNGETILSQLVVYKLNEEGKLSAITTASNRDAVFSGSYTPAQQRADVQLNAFKIAYQADSSDVFRTATKSFGLKCPADENTKIFFISDDPRYQTTDYYWVGSVSDLAGDQSLSNVLGYKTSAKLGTAEAIVADGVATVTKVSYETRLAAVKKVSKVINENDEIRTRVTFVINGKIVAYNLSEAVEKKYTLREGDIIRFATDRKYEISDIRIVCQVDEEGNKIPFENQFNETKNDYYILHVDDRCRIASGIVYDYDNGVLCMSRGNITEVNESNPLEYYKGISSAFICVIDENEVTAGTEADIMPGSKIFISTRYEVVRDIFIYK